MKKPINIPMPEISPNFTVEDIHKIREWNYERRKNMTTEERCADIHRSSLQVQAEIAALRAKREAI